MISNIRAERARLDMSQHDLAERVGVSESLVRNWEAGRSAPKPRNLIALSDLFGCSTDWLLGLSQSRTN